MKKEKIQIEYSANLMRGIEGVGGKLKITEKELIFNPHSFNIQKKVLKIPIREIVSVRERNTMGIIPNGIGIETKSGVVYKFVTWKREDIMKLIYKIRNNEIGD